ncbi:MULTISPECIES: hypothetical protein [unclassified Streptomyces]|uniref:hypothetical protein n=1 Tax=unclassified Streptomyces TaxID=2593676 RepID=UPI002E29C1B9|nr:hypothetical protein [Streptomyces sp. NBC_01439]
MTLVPAPPYVVAMTFVMARNLLGAEGVALAAWEHWLRQSWLDAWRLVSCAGDLGLGVPAVAELFVASEGADDSGGF